MINGKYHICPYSAHGMELGVVPLNNNDFVNAREHNIADSRTELKQLFRKKHISACHYCEGNTFLSKTIKAAEQINEVNK
jgi:hypothetical protein